MRLLIASVLALTMLGATAASADVGVGMHIGGVGAGIYLGGSHHHHHCSSWGWRHHHHDRYCRRW